MKTATIVEKIKKIPGDFVVRDGGKAIYKLSVPLDGHKYVLVSTACVLEKWETYVFPCDKNGEVLSWDELDCSRKGCTSHAEVLRDAGYEIVEA